MTDPRDTRIAELEAEVGRLTAFSADVLERIRPIYTAAVACAVETEDRAQAPKAAIGLLDLLLTARGYALVGDSEQAAESLGVLIEREQSQSLTPPAPVAQEKPPEAEEPAIVQTIRLVAQAPGSERCVTLEPEDARELLAFIDSRKAAPT